MKQLLVERGMLCATKPQAATERVDSCVAKPQGGAADDGCWYVDSAGIGGWHVGELPDHRMREAARRRGIELTHRCRQVATSDFAYFDLIIGMDDENLRDLRRIAPNAAAQAKIHSIGDWLPAGSLDHVPDPYYGSAAGFSLALDLLQTACANLVSEE